MSGSVRGAREQSFAPTRQVQPLCGAEIFMPPPRWAAVGSKPRPGCVGQGAGADSDEAGHAFQKEAGHLFRSEAGRDSDLMSATRVRFRGSGR